MRYQFFLILTIAVISYQGGSAAFAQDLNELSKDVRWQRLLHVEGSLFGRTSKANGKFFFVAGEEGKVHPEKELAASIEALAHPEKKVGRLEGSFECVFPARAKFIREKVSGSFPPSQICSEYKEWRENLAAESISIVYSSAYPQNPASLFGHTFLRVNSKKNEGKRRLLDYGINFAAKTENDLSLIYALKGVFGGYQGYFSLAPYFEKLNEYGLSESRDLWEFDLSLSADELDWVLAHLWEVFENTSFSYYYFDENCSYQLLKLLEVAKVDRSFSSFWSYVVPIETVKKVEAEGWIAHSEKRSSLRKKAYFRIHSLTVAERNEFDLVLRDQKPVEQINSSRVLEALQELLFYEKHRDKGFSDPSKQVKFREILVKRSTLKEEGFAELSEDKRDSPLYAHGPFRIGVGLGQMNSKWVGDLQFRLAIHDLLNDERGYSANSQIESGLIQIRYSEQTQSIFLKQLDVMHAYSLFPITDFEKTFSWKMRFSHLNPFDLGCVDCTVAHVSGGIGASTFLANEALLGYALASAKLEWGSALGMWRVAPYLELGTLARISYRTKLLFQYQRQADLFQSYRQLFADHFSLSVAQTLSTRLDFRFSFQHVLKTALTQTSQTEALLSTNFYF